MAAVGRRNRHLSCFIHSVMRSRNAAEQTAHTFSFGVFTQHLIFILTK